MKKIKLNEFELFLQNLLKKGKYSELIDILNVLSINKIDQSILRIMAEGAFRSKRYNTCIKLCSEFMKYSNVDDYFICEILAESAFQQNNLSLALEMYERALSVRPNLKQASYRVLLLRYRLRNILDEDLLQKVQNNSIKNLNLNHLRSVSYLQYKEKRYDEAYKNLQIIQNNSKTSYYPDVLTMHSILVKGCLYYGEKVTEKIREYESFLKEASFRYRYENNSRDQLLVTLAPASGFAFQKYIYDADKLFLVDGTGTYFTLSIQGIADHILDLYVKRKYKKISIVGSSKGASAVIMLINILQKRLPKVLINAVAFSPQVVLWPFNKNLTIPSYRVLAEYIDTNPLLTRAFEETRNTLSFNIKSPNKLFVFYGKNFRMDVKEANKIVKKSNQVKIVELNYSGHGTSIPLTIPEGKSQDELRRVYSNLPIDEDFAELGGDKIVDIVDEIFTIYSNPEMRLHKFL